MNKVFYTILLIIMVIQTNLVGAEDTCYKFSAGRVKRVKCTIDRYTLKRYPGLKGIKDRRMFRGTYYIDRYIPFKGNDEKLIRYHYKTK